MASPRFILAIDQGTTSTRVLLFNKEGNPVAKHQVEIKQHYPKPGWTEHCPNEILQSVVTCATEALKSAGATKADVAAIGITNQRETTVAWDSTTGEHLHRAIVWLDLRTAGTVMGLTKSEGADRFRPQTGLPVSTYFSAVKMKWMIDNVPAVKQAVDKGKCKFGTIDSWLIYKLTGGKSSGIHVTDVSNASRYMLMNIEQQQWDKGVCKAVGIPLEALPTIKSNAEVYGKVKGHAVLEGVPIASALGDQHAALLGQGCLQVGTSKNTYGTGCFMLLNTGTKPVPSKHGLLTTVGFKLGPDVPTTFALEGAVACAGSAVQWLRDNMKLITSAPEIEELANKVEDSSGVMFVPAFTGLFAPYWRDDARAACVGMTLFTKKEHVCRAVLEAVAFSTVDVLTAMRKDTGLSLGSMRVDGGMTVNNLLMQIQADLLGCEVLRAKFPEATVFGAAFAAGLAVKFFTNVEEVHGMLKKHGGHESFTPLIGPITRGKELERWHDAVHRTLCLARWDPNASAEQREAAAAKGKTSKGETLIMVQDGTESDGRKPCCWTPI